MGVSGLITELFVTREKRVVCQYLQQAGYRGCSTCAAQGTSSSRGASTSSGQSACVDLASDCCYCGLCRTTLPCLVLSWSYFVPLLQYPMRETVEAMAGVQELSSASCKENILRGVSGVAPRVPGEIYMQVVVKRISFSFLGGNY